LRPGSGSTSFARRTDSAPGSTGSSSSCRDRLRRRGTVRFIPLADGFDPPDRDPFAAFLERDALLGAVSGLSADERIIVVLRFWADLPLEAIANRLDAPLGTIKSRLHRAIGRLREMQEFDEGADPEARR
jgi:RNA polymerase sigma factor (sigma-70 family)